MKLAELANATPEQRKIRKLKNKVKLLEIDKSYRTTVYVEAYTLLEKIKSKLTNLTGNEATLAIAKLIDEWSIKDEKNYQDWLAITKQTRKEQRKNAK